MLETSDRGGPIAVILETVSWSLRRTVAELSLVAAGRLFSMCAWMFICKCLPCKDHCRARYKLLSSLETRFFSYCGDAIYYS